MSRKVLTIAGHEYVTNVRRREFILITLGLPLLFLFFGGLSLLGATAAAGLLAKNASMRVGLVDPAGVIDLKAASKVSGVEVIGYRDVRRGMTDVKSRGIRALVVLPQDYLSSGRVVVYRAGGSLLSERDRVPVGDMLERGLLSRSGANARLVNRAVNPTADGLKVYVLDRSGRWVTRSVAREAARFGVPYTFTILLTTAIFISASYLLRGIADEKENRVIEVVLSSVSADELLLGKLIGLSGVGLTQVGVWIGLGAVPLILRFGSLLHLSPLAIGEAMLFFALGFWFYATLMAGLGALGTSYRESQQVAGTVSMAAFLPVMMIPVLIEYPNGTLARVLSLIPFTAPTTMVLRTTASEVRLWDVALSAAVIILSSWLVLKLSARLFRFGMLAVGKRPTMIETLRWLRQA